MKPFILLDTRKQVTTGPDAGRCHIKIKASIPVYVNGKRKSKPRRAKTWVYATQEEFDTMMGNRMGKILQEKRDKVDAKLRKAEDICKIPNITPDQYKRLMDGAGNFESITGMFEWYIGECLKEDPVTGEARDGNAIALTNAMRFFCRYKKSNYISYAEITKEWLEDCKAWALLSLFLSFISSSTYPSFLYSLIAPMGLLVS